MLPGRGRLEALAGRCRPGDVPGRAVTSVGALEGRRPATPLPAGRSRLPLALATAVQNRAARAPPPAAGSGGESEPGEGEEQTRAPHRHFRRLGRRGVRPV